MTVKKPDRTRLVDQHWVRDPEGKPLENPPPTGVRPPNNIIWGHTLKDFYRISRIPGGDDHTIWSRSMIKEYGENYLKEEHSEEPAPRRLRPWPCLTLPDHLAASAALGYIDEGCDSMHGRPIRRVQDDTSRAGTRSSQATVVSRPALRCRLGRDSVHTAADMDADGAEAMNCVDESCGDGACCTVFVIHRILTSFVAEAKAPVGLPVCPSAVDSYSLSPLSLETNDAVTSAKDEAKVLDTTASQPVATSKPVKPVTASPTEPAAAPALSKAPIVSPPPPPPTPEPPTFHNLPKLEEFIPEEYFPDILYVNDPDHITTKYSRRCDSRTQSQEPAVPRKYKRVWPRSAPPPPPSSLTSPPTVPEPETNLRIAHLNLASAPRLGVGNHSVVHRAALRLPHPLAARSPTGEVTVAAKAGFRSDEARPLLLNEGRMYDAFPKHLQEGWCGLNLVAPIMHPVPVGPVVPKFYGYYVPVREDVEEAKQEMEILRRFDIYDSWYQMSPLLLLEECGAPIVPSKFTADERSECYSLALRLHHAEFTQNSFYVRNILRQPGPLTVAPSARSDSTPSFRIIDFGRGEHLPEKMVLEEAHETWLESRDYEVRKAHLELEIVRDFEHKVIEAARMILQ
ncbi:hypothetical protein GGX14DRAFT_359384 [Mycena pura]|uniref:Protein kinase domain-containing protein n=1 Tax=Mycena pura TaxID=153505 RepID=A0AAD6VKL8_9AGAR|nr:hypothetical protein GGX14DRAFT_359384 [Mycena pura]